MHHEATAGAGSQINSFWSKIPDVDEALRVLLGERVYRMGWRLVGGRGLEVGKWCGLVVEGGGTTICQTSWRRTDRKSSQVCSFKPEIHPAEIDSGAEHLKPAVPALHPQMISRRPLTDRTAIFDVAQMYAYHITKQGVSCKCI